MTATDAMIRSRLNSLYAASGRLSVDLTAFGYDGPCATLDALYAEIDGLEAQLLDDARETSNSGKL